MRHWSKSAPPDFIGVGAEGPGAGWWLSALLGHPEISGPRGGRGALDFFRPFCERELGKSDIAHYHRQFPAPRSALRGEWSEGYMADGWVPPLLARVAPEARLLVMLSDPVARVRATYEERKAVLEQGRRIFLTDVVDRAQYAFQILRLQRYFPAERILVLQLERCLQDPAAEHARTLRFLGVSDDVKPPAPGTVRTGLLRRRRIEPPAQPPAPPLWPELEQTLPGALEPDLEALTALVPEIDTSLWWPHAGLSAC